MTVTVSYLGPARDWTGIEGERVEIGADATLHELGDRLCSRHEALAERRGSLRFAINDALAQPDAAVVDGDHVAVIPPVSGGSEAVGALACDLVEIRDDAIDGAAVRAFLDDHATERDGGDACCHSSGACVVFEGMTRREHHAERGALRHLEYEAHPRLAVAEMGRLAREARDRWPVERLALVHRSGVVACGQTSVLIGVSCGHRAEAFEACRWLIDALKARVPIWKREVWSDGTRTWVDPTACCAPIVEHEAR